MSEMPPACEHDRDIVFLGGSTESLEPCFAELSHERDDAPSWDLGGSGSNMRTPSCCVGPARCEWACYDTLDICHNITMEYQDELHRPAFPYKFKFKFDGCPNCCVASIARADFSFIGTWRDNIRIDQEAVQAYIGGEFPPNAGAHSGHQSRDAAYTAPDWVIAIATPPTAAHTTDVRLPTSAAPRRGASRRSPIPRSRSIYPSRHSCPKSTCRPSTNGCC